jgi:hypothetical protein
MSVETMRWILPLILLALPCVGCSTAAPAASDDSVQQQGGVIQTQDAQENRLLYAGANAKLIGSYHIDQKRS